MSDLGNQHNNGPHQDQTFDNPSAICLALWAKDRFRLRDVTDALNSFFTKGVVFFLSFFKFFFITPSDLLCLRSPRSKCNAAAINYLLFFLLLHLDLKFKLKKSCSNKSVHIIEYNLIIRLYLKFYVRL